MAIGGGRAAPARSWEASSPDARRALLAASRLFQVLRPAELDNVVAHAVTRRFARDALIMRKGDPSNSMAVILQGRVRIGSTAEDGREVTLGVVGPGEVLGEIALLDGEARSADVTALDDCVLLAVDRVRFMQLLRGNADLCLRLMAFLCGRLRRTNTALEEMALLDLPGRLGRLLLRLAHDYGAPGAKGTRIELKLSQKDMSMLIGSSREKVNRQLRSWEQDGVLARENGYVVLVRPAALGGDA